MARGLPSMLSVALVACTAAKMAREEPIHERAPMPRVAGQGDVSCESIAVWMGRCMEPPASISESNELRWRDPVAEYTPDVLCAGECMLAPLYETVTVHDQAQQITPFDRAELDELTNPTWRSRIRGLLRELRELVLPYPDETEDAADP